MKNPQEKQAKKIQSEIRKLLISLKPDICDDYRAHEDDDKPGMCVTIATNDFTSWNYQTGDNSYTGGAYGLKHWAVISLYRNSNCATLAEEIINELWDGVRECGTEYEYCINLDERGEFNADVRYNGETVYEINGHDIFEDGFMNHSVDVCGLAKYLISLGILQANDTIKLS